MRHASALAAACVLGLAVLAGQPSVVPASAVVDAQQLLADLKTLSADDMEGRQVGTAGGARARAFILRRFKESGVAPFASGYEQPFTFAGRGADAPTRKGVNVIGRIDGTRVSKRYIVVSAHYDHEGVRNGQVFNGADDNASGAAALFAIAKQFTAKKPMHSLILAAFDGEEAGLRGSRAFVQRPPVDMAALALDLNLDMIGREPDNRLFVVGTALQPFLKPTVDAIAAKAPVRLLTGHEDPRQPEDWSKDSDHYTFVEAGIPALYFGVEDFAQHHKATDDYETMSHAFYVRAVETLILAVQEFDKAVDSLPRR